MEHMAAEVIVPPPPVATLTDHDRCDRCGSRAFLRATFPQGGGLLLCAHHGRQHLPALRAGGAYITDETDQVPG